MKISTWNVNSVNARIESLEKFIKQDQSDIYLLQELKTIEDGFPKELIKKMGYISYVNGQKAWNGVAILSKNHLNITNTSKPTQSLAYENVFSLLWTKSCFALYKHIVFTIVIAPNERQLCIHLTK